MTSTHAPIGGSSRISVDAGDLAAATPKDRNRAVDFYRAIAMGFVALGHWVGMAVVLDAGGELVTGNALDFSPGLWWVTWIGQVMPLFFFVGGFASATSLRSADRKGLAPSDWVATRLRRMLAPAVLLAGFWMAAIAAGFALGLGTLVLAGAVAAAIPLWFLANYTIDTAIAPYTYHWFQRSPVKMVSVLGLAIALVEAANLAGVALIPQLNWVLGWLLFQVAGFAWHDGLLPTGRKLAALSAATWIAAIGAVAFGPWPATMLHHGGLEHSPTHPPSTAFILFGLAYSFTAALASPAINRWLLHSTRSWKATVAANGVAMSVYLWHMTAAVIVAAAIYAMGMTPMVVVGTGAWWATKLPFIGLTAPVLALIVSRVWQTERNALFAPAVAWRGSARSMTICAIAISASVKMWSSPNPVVLCIGATVLLGIWRWVLAPNREQRVG